MSNTPTPYEVKRTLGFLILRSQRLMSQREKGGMSKPEQIQNITRTKSSFPLPLVHAGQVWGFADSRLADCASVMRRELR